MALMLGTLSVNPGREDHRRSACTANRHDVQCILYILLNVYISFDHSSISHNTTPLVGYFLTDVINNYKVEVNSKVPYMHSTVVTYSLFSDITLNLHLCTGVYVKSFMGGGGGLQSVTVLSHLRLMCTYSC